MRRAFANRVDTTAQALIAYAEKIGFLYCPINGALDGNLAWGQKVIAIDWKTPGGDLTRAQIKLIARGFPVRFISTTLQLDQLKQELMK